MKTEITKYDPCSEAVEFRNGFKTFKEAWENCPRGDWMLWLASRSGVNIRILTYAKALCAETVIHLMKDKRSINAVKVAKRFGKYRATKEELKNATYAAADATYAADAADATYAAADATYAAAYATYAAADADAARKENQLQTADICRKHLTKAVFSKLKIK